MRFLSQDLYLQRQVLLHNLFTVWGSSANEDSLLFESADGKSIEEIIEAVEELEELYESERSSALGIAVTRNVMLTIVVDLVLLVTIV